MLLCGALFGVFFAVPWLWPGVDHAASSAKSASQRAASTDTAASAPAAAVGASAATAASPTLPTTTAGATGLDAARTWLASEEKVWDLCGVGRLPIPPAWVAVGLQALLELPAHLGEDALKAGRTALFDAMEQGSPRAQAVVAMWRVMTAGQQQWRQADAAPVTTKLEPVDTTAQSASVAAKLAPFAETDPVLAAWLVVLCQNDRTCKADAQARWLRADPYNALAIASGLDTKAPPEKLAQVRAALAQAKGFQMNYGALAATALTSLQGSLQNSVPLYVQQMLLIEAIGVEAATVLPPMQPIFSLCRSNSDVTSSVARSVTSTAQCNAIARLMVDHSDNLLTHNIGLRVGEKLGWPKAEVDLLRAQVDPAKAGTDFLPYEQPNSCAAVKATKAWITDLSEKGELALIRERVQAANRANPAANPAASAASAAPAASAATAAKS
jgi:hypothetical protein